MFVSHLILQLPNCLLITQCYFRDDIPVSITSRVVLGPIPPTQIGLDRNVKVQHAHPWQDRSILLSNMWWAIESNAYCRQGWLRTGCITSRFTIWPWAQLRKWLHVAYNGMLSSYCPHNARPLYVAIRLFFLMNLNDHNCCHYALCHNRKLSRVLPTNRNVYISRSLLQKKCCHSPKC